MFNMFSAFCAMWVGSRIGEGLADIVIDAEEKAKKKKRWKKEKVLLSL